jgi:BirA family biotin operon repressor/biotin-[acetyl-CoA-carboxylase] ligase
MMSQKIGLPFPQIEIHWPNDIYMEGRKIAGILIEKPTAKHFVIGIGVNTNNSVKNAPNEIHDKIISLYEIYGTQIEQHEFLHELCKNIMTVWDLFPSRFSEIIKNIETCLQNKDKPINVVTETEIIEGICRGLNADGSLRVQTSCGEVSIVSGILKAL